MTFGSLRRFALLGLTGLTICGCGSGPQPSTPAATEAAAADAILQRPAGWDEARKKSDALYQAGKYAEHIAVLEAFAKAHPKFADVEIQLGDTWRSEHEVLGPLPKRLAQAAAHYRRAIQAADASGDDFGRQMATDSLLGVHVRQIFNSASLPIAEQRQLIVDAGSLADDVLKKAPGNADAREIKSKLVEVEARLKK
jgi:tetratricopeptide (TPR) repeat protein